ncbi:MAG: hypothetical protein IPL39_09490 [Opitutaceae bacterium]|nr:hypothetical protein [Opitutaceae bacterium]
MKISCFRSGGPLLAAGWLLLGAGLQAAPLIQVGPQPATVIAGTSASFSVSATGTGSLHFDWRRGGTSIGAPDSANYATAATALSDSGAVFSVSVSDATGSTQSGDAFLTVNPASALPFSTWAVAIADPAQRGPSAMPQGDGVANLTKYALGIEPGSVVTFGDLPVLVSEGWGWVFRYERDRSATGISVVVERSATLAAGSWANVPATKVADDGVRERWEAPVTATGERRFYRLGVSTKANAVPTIGTQPLGATVGAGQSPTLSVAATGTGPLAYQWRKNGALIAGATAATYSPPPLTQADNGARFTVLVTGEAGTVASAEAVVVVTEGASVAALVDQVSLDRYTVNLRDRLFTRLGDNRGLLNGTPSPQLVAARPAHRAFHSVRFCGHHRSVSQHRWDANQCRCDQTGQRAAG